ncbi:MAG: hypothetical protein SRB2_03034 [Desulfobacteraceae bacterium Eth-SRB2]|nr:MAG: hypothetical protein SRB2_03034 [Desulfobacteraceae bacterium Eth-SRB2]
MTGLHMDSNIPTNIFETFEKRPLLPNACVPDGRDLRFASTVSNFNPPPNFGGLILKILNVFVWLKISPSLALNKIEHFSKVSLLLWLKF